MRHGMSLIEVLLGVALLALVWIAWLGIQRTTVGLPTQIDRRLAAAARAATADPLSAQMGLDDLQDADDLSIVVVPTLWTTDAVVDPAVDRQSSETDPVPTPHPGSARSWIMLEVRDLRDEGTAAIRIPRLLPTGE